MSTTNTSLETRIAKAAQSGEDAFWTAVAAEFPEVKSGDLDPETSLRLSEKMKASIRIWLEINSSMQPDEKIEE
jgi:hypothetical protein